MNLLIRRDATIEVEGYGALDRGDPLAILDWLRTPVVLEDGITGKALFRALKPWSEALSRLAWMDFDAWERFVARAHLREVGDPPEAVVLEGEGPHRTMHSVEIGPEITMTKRMVMSVAWRALGVDGPEGEETYVNLSLASPSSWTHLPLRINGYAVVNERFMKDSNLVPRGNDGSTALSYVKPIYVAPTFWDAVVKGFLDGVSARGTPDEAKAEREKVANAIAANAVAELREIEMMRPSYMPNDKT